MSRATLVEERQEEVQDDTNVENLESREEFVQEEPQEAPQEQTEEPIVPEKYQGKSLEEVVQMHQEAEKLLGKQSSEVGDLRKVVDEYISTQLQQNQVTPEQPAEDLDLFTEPDAYIQQKIDNHPAVKEARESSFEYKKQASLALLKAKHPDMDAILRDKAFAEWVKASKYRTKMFVDADQNLDHEAADELFSQWKERTNNAVATAAVEKNARKQTVKNANAGTAKGSASPSRKKIYRRADIIKLMKTDPDRYNSLADEILLAYAEKRVR